MKKKTILSVTSFVLLLSIGLGGALMHFEKPIITDGTLNVNGTDIISKNVSIRKQKFSNPVLPRVRSFKVKIKELFSKEYYYYADLPLTEVLKSLGMSVEWVDGNTANVTYEDKKYVLNLTKVSMVEVGTTHNLIAPVPGSHRVHTVLDRELILDGLTIKLALQAMGVDINVTIDIDKSIVNITNRED